MKTATWKVLDNFEKPVNGKNIHFNEVPTVMPEEVKTAVEKNWQNLLEKQLLEMEKDSGAYLAPYGDIGLNCLYDKNGKKLNWPGGAVSLVNHKMKENGVVLEVAQMSFPYIQELKKSEVVQMFKDRKMPILRPSLAICTFGITLDNKLILTERGPRTNMYPGRFYGQGGNPESTSTNIVEHQLGEINDEIHVLPGEVYSEDLYFGGIIEDTENLRRKPDLVGWVPINVDSNDVAARKSAVAYEDREPDAVGVRFIENSPEELMKYLTETTKPKDYCPPANGGLVLYGHHIFGNEWSKEVLRKLER